MKYTRYSEDLGRYVVPCYQMLSGKRIEFFCKTEPEERLRNGLMITPADPVVFGEVIDRLAELEIKAEPRAPLLLASAGFDPWEASELCCPTCSNPVTNYWVRGAKPKYCQFCGQALDWRKEAKE